MLSTQEWAGVWDAIAGQYAESVSISRLREVIQLTDVGRIVPDEVILEALVRADTNNDGELQREEFMHIVSYVEIENLVTQFQI